MTEQQLRDVLARVVPEAPDTVADPTPVVRVAKRQRNVRTAGVSVLAAVLAVGTVLGVQAVRDDEQTQVVDGPSLDDPYTTASCLDPSQPWETATVADLSSVTAVRYCSRPSPLEGFSTVEGPADALVTGLDTFVAGVRDLPDADPARCAAVDPIPSDNRLLLQLADGTVVGVATGLCDDAQVEGRTVSADGITALLLSGLRNQRDDNAYAPAEVTAPSDCLTSGTSPADPTGEHLVAAIACTGSGVLTAAAMAADETTRLDQAWRAATQGAPNCDDPAALGLITILARTDRGDLVRLDPMGCGQYLYYESDQTQHLVTFTYEDNTGGGS